MAKPLRLSRWAEHLIALAVYLGLALAFTWPMLGDLAHAVYVSPGSEFFFAGFEDASQNVWNMWWVRYALLRGINPFFTPLLYHPEGAQLYFHTLNITTAVLMLPVQAVAGPVVSYNLALILGMFLTGYAGFLLVRAYVPGLIAPLISGALLTAAPFHVLKLYVSHLNLVSMQWLLLFMLALILVARHPGRWPILVASAGLLVVVFTDWYWALVAGLFTLLWVGATLVEAWWLGRRNGQHWAAAGRLFGRYTLVGAVTLLWLIPLGWAIWRERQRSAPATQAQLDLWSGFIRGYSSDALGLFFPNIFQPWWGGWAQHWTQTISPPYASDGWYTAGGWVLMGLALLGMLWYGRQHATLLAVFAGAWLFSLGPELRILGWNTGLPLPYALLEGLPLIDTARRPNLFGAICLALAAIFAGLALARLLAQRQRWGQLILVAAVVVLAVIELWPPHLTAFAFGAPPVLSELAARPGAVVDLPTPLPDADSSRPLRHQMLHLQPTLRAYVARAPAYPTFEYAPLVYQLSRTRIMPTPDLVALDQAALRTQQCFYQLRHVLVQTALLSPDEHERLDLLLTELTDQPPAPWYDDGTMQIYELPLFAEQCAPFVFLGGDWHRREQDGPRVWRWTNGASEIFVVNPATTPVTVRLRLKLEAPEAGRELRVLQAQTTLAQFAVAREGRWYDVALQVPPGQTRLILASETTDDPVAGRVLGVSVQAIEVR